MRMRNECAWRRHAQSRMSAPMKVPTANAPSMATVWCSCTQAFPISKASRACSNSSPDGASVRRPNGASDGDPDGWPVGSFVACWVESVISQVDGSDVTNGEQARRSRTSDAWLRREMKRTKSTSASRCRINLRVYPLECCSVTHYPITGAACVHFVLLRGCMKEGTLMDPFLRPPSSPHAKFGCRIEYLFAVVDVPSS